MEEWWSIANGPALWISGFVLAGVAILGATLMQILGIREGKKIGIGMKEVNEIRKSTIITCIGPGLAITFGMIPLMIALSPGVAWLRESAGIGSIQYELITASQGAAAAGMELGPGMSREVFASALFVMSTGCLPWLIMGMVYAPIAKNMIARSGKSDTRVMQLVIVIMMIIVFGDAVAQRTLPLATPKFWAAFISAVVVILFGVAAKRLKNPHIMEYALVTAMLVGMFGTFLIFGK
jgi:hypothetical protein